MTKKRNIFEILSILERKNKALTSSEIARELQDIGTPLTERMIRNYLQELDGMGFTENMGREGRGITEEGRDEIKQGYVQARTDFVFDKITQMITETRFDLHKRSGEIIVNLSLIDEEEEQNARKILGEVCLSGFFPPFIKIAQGGEKLCGRWIPEGRLGLATVSSATIDQIILKKGIYDMMLYSLLIKIKDHKPARCTDFTSPFGCSFDPWKTFISKGVSVYDAATRGEGSILADYREVPYTSRIKTINLLRDAADVLGGKVVVGRPGAEILGLPTKRAYMGVIAFGGESLPAALEERGIKTNTEIIAGAINFRELEPVAPVQGEVLLL